MKPTYQSPDGSVRLYLGDCLEVLPTLEAGSVDAVVTSPPYNQKLDQFTPSGMHKESRWVSKISNGYLDSMPENDYQGWQIEILNELHRVCSDGASCFYNHKVRYRDGVVLHPLDLVRKSDWQLRQEIIWQRNGSCTMNARMFAPNDERIYWLRKGNRHRTWNQECVGHMSVWKMASVRDAEHACVFPSEIPLRAISSTTIKD